MRRKVKNPCPVCGRPTDAQGWCGSREHGAGNPFGGINCLTVPPSWDEIRDGVIEEHHRKQLRRDFELLSEEADMVDG